MFKQPCTRSDLGASVSPVATARTVLRAVSATGPAHLMFAAPVCAAEAQDRLVDEADSVVALHSPREFHALGLFYRDFAPLGDADVQRMCARTWTAAVPV